MKNLILVITFVASANLHAAETAYWGASMPVGGPVTPDAKDNAVLASVEYPVTDFEGNYRGMENGHCRLTYEKINGRKALTVIFNTKEGKERAKNSILADASAFPIKEFAVFSETSTNTHLSYRNGEAVLSNLENMNATGEVVIMYIGADPALKAIRSVRVRFFENVKAKGRNETGSVLCTPALS